MENYLKEIHAKDYIGCDDDMPESFERFLEDLEIEDWLKYAEDYKLEK